MLAASRVSPTAKIPRIAGHERGAAAGIELQELIPASDKGYGESVNSNAHKNMAYRLLKWGEVEMPEDWHRESAEEGNDQEAPRVGHLSFGTILDDPQPPTEGYFYA
ncbi:hypothetical protein CGRA01v4_01460 [Colletotrichum graminicola]|uniref:Uncharacterized protein n=1 Tax=Colletotrichum graminicola (strain M1.001 / M2 / FGSC 10212) TaxID=645133 RepID=E3QL45_COLGM|nr:uncharacterized protein GLRG_06872 [Colletotrichum graminicola M1.001]EFQ31583.1 hypothetical protein GLRG_06872 [Colletotrichum graminicola M1.001]WDK10181.1 hypothetical protein CGRA01v4_01460 [Colletotrichum graminicola]